MPEVITISIDVTKLEKSHFKRITRRSGADAVFADIVLMPRQDDHGNDYMVVQGVSKAERDKGVKGPILGNGKIMGQRSKPKTQQKEAFQASPPLPMTPQKEGDVPF